MADLELCAAISDAFGPSGYEKEAVDVIESSLGGLAAHRDSMQNLYVSLPQNVGGRPLVMLDAHTDEVGFMVQSITARDCPPVASTVRIFMPKPINMMEYCKIFLLQNVIPASMADGRFQNARIIPNKIANTGPPISFPTVGI